MTVPTSLDIERNGVVLTLPEKKKQAGKDEGASYFAPDLIGKTEDETRSKLLEYLDWYGVVKAAKDLQIKINSTCMVIYKEASTDADGNTVELDIEKLKSDLAALETTSETMDDLKTAKEECINKMVDLFAKAESGDTGALQEAFGIRKEIQSLNKQIEKKQRTRKTKAEIAAEAAKSGTPVAA